MLLHHYNRAGKEEVVKLCKEAELMVNYMTKLISWVGRIKYFKVYKVEYDQEKNSKLYFFPQWFFFLNHNFMEKLPPYNKTFSRPSKYHRDYNSINFQFTITVRKSLLFFLHSKHSTS